MDVDIAGIHLALLCVSLEVAFLSDLFLLSVPTASPPFCSGILNMRGLVLGSISLSLKHIKHIRLQKIWYRTTAQPESKARENKAFGGNFSLPVQRVGTAVTAGSGGFKAQSPLFPLMRRHEMHFTCKCTCLSLSLSLGCERAKNTEADKWATERYQTG